MAFWMKCPYCGEHFELEEELDKHLEEDHFKLSPNPQREIPAKKWREMSADGILNSIDIALRVLEEKSIETPEQVAKALTIIKDLTEQLLEMAKP